MKLSELKKTFYQAVFSNDYLMETLVLKGGSAINSFYDEGDNGRTSLDLDFSMADEFEDISKTEQLFEKELSETFKTKGYHIFDLKLEEKPDEISEDLRDFWGGYNLEFKLIENEHSNLPLENKRRQALKFENKGKVKVDISKFEIIEGSVEKELDENGLATIKVYTPEMIVCEKLRAICQQMPEYGKIIKKSSGWSERTRDFYDIHLLVEKYKINIEKKKSLLKKIFNIKRVPFEFLFKISDPQVKALHEAGYPSLKATVQKDKLEKFEFYYQFVVALIERLKD